MIDWPCLVPKRHLSVHIASMLCYKERWLQQSRLNAEMAGLKIGGTHACHATLLGVARVSSWNSSSTTQTCMSHTKCRLEEQSLGMVPPLVPGGVASIQMRMLKAEVAKDSSKYPNENFEGRSGDGLVMNLSAWVWANENFERPN